MLIDDVSQALFDVRLTKAGRCTLDLTYSSL